MEPFFVKKALRFRVFFPWNLGVPRDIWLNSTLFQTILPGGPDLFSEIHPFNLFCRADLTYFHLFGSTSFHNKALWAGHLRKRPPVLILHVLTDPVLWFWVLPPASFRSLRLSPWTSICFMAPFEQNSWLCSPSSPATRGKNGTLSTSFCNTKGAHTDRWPRAAAYFQTK